MCEVVALIFCPLLSFGLGCPVVVGFRYLLDVFNHSEINIAFVQLLVFLRALYRVLHEFLCPHE